MNCQDYRTQRLLDQEEGRSTPEAQRHAAECVPCQTLAKEEERLRSELHKLASSEHAPAELRQKIAGIATRGHLLKEHGIRDTRRWMFTAAAAILLMGAIGGVFWRHYSERTPSPEQLAKAFVADYLEYLPGREEVAANSPRVAEEWLQGRVDFPVHVPEIPGSKLEGARICDISGRKAALLQYRHAASNTLVSVFVAEEPKAYEGREMSIHVETAGHGVHSRLWCHRGLIYDVVASSDGPSPKGIAEAVQQQSQ